MKKTRREFLGSMGVTIGSVALLGACIRIPADNDNNNNDNKCPDCGQDPCKCQTDNKCPGCGQDPCKCQTDNKCPACGQDPCECQAENKCPACGQDPCECQTENKCPACGQDPCECQTENKCPDCGQDPCECSPCDVMIARVIPKSGLTGCQACSGSARYCVPACAYDALIGTTFAIPPTVLESLCTGCGDCVTACKDKAKKNGIELILKP